MEIIIARIEALRVLGHRASETGMSEVCQSVTRKHSVRVIPEYRFLPISAVEQMIDCAGEFYPRLARHTRHSGSTAKLRSSQNGYVHRLTSFPSLSAQLSEQS